MGLACINIFVMIHLFLDSASIKWVPTTTNTIPIEAVLFKINIAVTETSYKFSYVHCTYLAGA